MELALFCGKRTSACLRIGQSHKGPQVEAAKIIQRKGTNGFDLSIFFRDPSIAQTDTDSDSKRDNVLSVVCDAHLCGVT